MSFMTLAAAAADAAIAPEPSFWERTWFAAVGPVVGALFGTGIIGLWVWRITVGVQNQRAEVERNLERERVDRVLETQMRMDTLTTAYAVAAKFYMELGRFARLKRLSPMGSAEMQEARRALDQDYLECRAAALVLEARLEAIFESPEPADLWHQVDDLQTVRYMRLTDQATLRTYFMNIDGAEGKRHSRLNLLQLHDDGVLIETYRSAMKSLQQLLLTSGVVSAHMGAGNPGKTK